jgi:hypothetical protein
VLLSEPKIPPPLAMGNSGVTKKENPVHGYVCGEATVLPTKRITQRFDGSLPPLWSAHGIKISDPRSMPVVEEENQKVVCPSLMRVLVDFGV